MAVDLSMVGIRGQQAGMDYLVKEQQIAETKVNNQVKEFELAQAEKLQSLNDEAAATLRTLAGGRKAPGTLPGMDTDSAADPLRVVGDILLRGGATEQGADLLGKASEIAKRESDMKNDEHLARQRQLGNIEKGAQLVGRFLGGARNASEWEYGLKKVREAGLIDEQLLQPIIDGGYDPDVAAYLRDQAVSIEAQARLDMQASTNARLEAMANNTITYQEQQLEIQRQRLAADIEHKAHIRKSSGGTTAAAVPPNTAAMDSVNRALFAGPLKGFKKNAENKDSINALADYIASNALAITKGNKAVSWDQAVQRAITSAQMSGAMKMVPGTEGLFGTSIGERAPQASLERGEGRTPETALPVVKGMSKNQLVKGRFYNTPKGVLQWNGSEFTQ